MNLIDLPDGVIDKITYLSGNNVRCICKLLGESFERGIRELAIELHPEHAYLQFSAANRVASKVSKLNMYSIPYHHGLHRHLPNYFNLRTLNIFNVSDLVHYTSHLAPALRSLTKLNILRIFSCNLGDMGMALLAPEIRELTSLRELTIQRTNLKFEGAKSLANVLENLVNLTKLNIFHNDFGDSGMIILAASLQKLKKLEGLDIKKVGMTALGAKSLGPVLESLTNLSILNLKGNYLQSEGIDAIKPCFTRLLSLNLSSTITTGSAYLASIINNGSFDNLQTLSLSFNGIGDADVYVFSQAIRKLTNLVDLDLFGNELCDDGYYAIKAALTSKIIYLELGDDDIN